MIPNFKIVSGIVRKNKEIIFVVFIVILISLVAGILNLFQTYLSHTREGLAQKIVSIKSDFKYEKGKWDLEAYNKDPDLLGFYPLYFMTTDGFVLDRRDPIHGFLDTSDFKRLLSFEKPQTVSSITSQNWRIYVRKIDSVGSTVGVIAVSYYNPPKEIIDQIDQKLIEAADFIYSQLKIEDKNIGTKELNIKAIDYDIAFNIIDSFNTIILKSANVDNTNRIPNFIDPSYVKRQLSQPAEKIIKDSLTGDLFMIRQASLEASDGSSIGIFVVGQSMSSIIGITQKYILRQTIISILIFLISILVLGFILKNKKGGAASLNYLPQEAFFNQKRGMLSIDGVDIVIPYATNQFYLLQTIFSNPAKRFETDELLERFGEEKSKIGSRKVYDAMLSINKKVSKVADIKLILNQNKTYQLNPKIIALKK